MAVNRLNEDSTYECASCYMMFPTFEIFETHIAHFHIYVPLFYQCLHAMCRKRFKLSQIEAHIASAHKYTKYVLFRLVHAQSKDMEIETTALKDRYYFLASGNDEHFQMRVSKMEEDRPNKFQCQNCKIIYLRYETFALHLVEVHESKSYRCSECEQKFSPTSIRNHVITSHSDLAGNMLFKSIDYNEKKKKWGWFFSSEKGFLHIKIDKFAMKQSPTHWCDICKMQFLDRLEAQSHLQIVHPFKKRVQCLHCDNVIVPSAIACLQHSKQHDFDVVEFKHLTLKKSYVYHSEELSVKNMDNKSFKCLPCRKLFSSFKDFEIHLHIVHQVIAFKCSLCPKHTSLEEVEFHMDTKHSREYKNLFFPAYWHLIDRAMKNRLNVMLIFKLISEINKRKIFVVKTFRRLALRDFFECQICNLNFESVGLLENHIRAKHYKSGLFMCSACPITLTLKDFKSHMSTHAEVGADNLVMRSGRGVKISVNSKGEHIFVILEEKDEIEEKRSACGICGLESVENIKDHLRCTHSCQYFSCTICSKVLDFTKLRTHIYEEHNTMKNLVHSRFQCATKARVDTQVWENFAMKYSITFEENKNLKAQKVTMFQVTFYKEANDKSNKGHCVSCDLKTDLELFEKHMVTHKTYSYSCFRCQFVANLLGILTHFREAHTVQCTKTYTFRAVSGGVVSYSASPRLVFSLGLTKHLSVKCPPVLSGHVILRIQKENGKTFTSSKCHICCEVFSSANNFFIHLNLKHCNTNWDYFCSCCNSVLKVNQNVYHMKTAHVSLETLDFITCINTSSMLRNDVKLLQQIPKTFSKLQKAEFKSQKIPEKIDKEKDENTQSGPETSNIEEGNSEIQEEMKVEEKYDIDEDIINGSSEIENDEYILPDEIEPGMAMNNKEEDLYHNDEFPSNHRVSKNQVQKHWKYTIGRKMNFFKTQSIPSNEDEVYVRLESTVPSDNAVSNCLVCDMNLDPGIPECHLKYNHSRIQLHCRLCNVAIYVKHVEIHMNANHASEKTITFIVTESEKPQQSTNYEEIEIETLIPYDKWNYSIPIPAENIQGISIILPVKNIHVQITKAQETQPQYRCYICSENFRLLSLVKSHLFWKHDNLSVLYCKTCRISLNFEDLHLHMQCYHSKANTFVLQTRLAHMKTKYSDATNDQINEDTGE